MSTARGNTTAVTNNSDSSKVTTRILTNLIKITENSKVRIELLRIHRDFTKEKQITLAPMLDMIQNANNVT